ncbi:MAG: DUF3300 domain-containing protein [Nitrospirae bacterium]|nr:DUF3300 domain-containing protein [Nitrospirota bacterium]MCL5422834.1 DUF3300 domain-containing protein [Nitrospirota bacterium]
MRTTTIIIRGLAGIIIAMLVMPPGIPAQDPGEPEQTTEQTTEQTERFGKEELAQMLAPIALYPDSLIAQILMASTYPLEIVEAERWLRQNKHLKGDELDKALQEKTWDPSVKSLCHFPDVLFAMSDKLDQTRKLGDAFLSQQDDAMATIQELRQKAQNQGNLRTTKEQQVIVEGDVIKIEPTDPEVVYVPVYDPFYVYGPWWYPAYPPYYWYYPPSFVITGGFISFGPPVFIGIGLFSWVWFDWHVHRIHIDIVKTRRFHRYRDRQDFDRHVWRHDPVHRRGVAYRDRKTSERFGTRPPRMPLASPEMRGYPGRYIERQDGRPSQIPIERQRDTVRPRLRTERERIQRAPARDNPFSGVGSGSFERKASERGGISRQGGEIKRPSGEIRRPGGEIRRPSRDGGRQSGGDQDKGGARGGGRRR